MARLELMDTVELMGSSDYRDRFVAEYIQTKIRYEKLKAFNTKVEAARRTASLDEGVQVKEPKHDCPASLLREQQAAMGEYLHLLEVRAVIEDIDLSDVMMYLEEKKKENAAGVSLRPMKNPEIEELKLKLEEYDSDWEIVEEAVGRVLEKGFFKDEDEEKLMAAGLNILHKIKLLDEPCREVNKDDSKAKICSDCVHLPICEYCAGHLKGFDIPHDNSCDMHLSKKSVKIEDAELSPEEIKKGLGYCIEGGDCMECLIYKITNGSNYCSDILMKSALRYIVKLEGGEGKCPER